MWPVRPVPRAEEMRAKDSILAISPKSVIGCSECSQVEDNRAFRRFWSYVRWHFPNNEEAGHPAKGPSTGGGVVWWFWGEMWGLAGASWVQLPADTLTQEEQSQVSWLEAEAVKPGRQSHRSVLTDWGKHILGI